VQPPSYISLFSGAGGLDLGLEQAGWSTRYASDIDPCAVETLLLNQQLSGCYLKEAVVEQADVRFLNGADILAKAGARRGDVPLLAGGPPCQSWSSAGHQLGMSDPRGQLLFDFVRLAGQLDVRWIMFENVRGLLTARGPDGVPGSALALLRKTLLSAGFQTHVELLNAADYGVPQRRVRLVIFGYRTGDPLAFPRPTHSRTLTADSELQPWVPLSSAINGVGPLAPSDVIKPTGMLAAQLVKLPPGSGVKSPGKAEATRPGGHWGYKQGAFVADTHLAARTVTANAQQDWVKDSVHGVRRLCPRECAAIQTFPAEWQFVGKRTDQYRLIGNAVPPLLAKALGKSLADHATDYRPAAIDLATLSPLAPKLQAAVAYTAKEEARNGESRRTAPARRAIKSVAHRR
jgi:DNA (cytosine-5)-methyltransferase 1